MSKTTVYVETSIVSYLTARPSRNLIALARQVMTREWWENRRDDFQLVTSRLVIAEAALGDAVAAAKRLSSLENLEILGINPTIEAIAAEIVARHLLPPKAEADALHIATAAWHGVDFVLTWNCRHIANAELLPSVFDYLATQKLKVPLIFTPEEFLGDVDALS